MKKILTSEQVIVGKWLFKNNQVTKDANCLRIEWLVQNYLHWVSKDESGWLNLYQDPNDNRYWELLFENSDYHGGGPPTLKSVSKSVAAERYKVDI